MYTNFQSKEGTYVFANKKIKSYYLYTTICLFFHTFYVIDIIFPFYIIDIIFPHIYRSPCLSKFNSSPLKLEAQSDYAADRPRGIWRKELLARGFALFVYQLWRLQRDQIKQYKEKVQDYEGIVSIDHLI